MKRLSMLLVALVAGCASVEEPKLEEPKSKASAEGAAPKAEAKVYKDYKAAMQAIWALRGKDKDAAAAAADQAAALAKTPDEKSEALFRKGDLYWNSRGDVRQGKFGLEALQVEGISARRRAASVSDLVKKYYPAKGKEGFADAEKLVAETLARADFTDAFAIVQVTTAIAGLEFDNFQVEKAEKRLAGLEKVKGVNLFDVIRARADLAVRKGDLAEGVRQFERILKDPKIGGNRWSAVESIVKLMNRDNRTADAVKVLRAAQADKTIAPRHKEVLVAGALVPAYLTLKDYQSAAAAVAELRATKVPENDKGYPKEIEQKAQELEFSIAVAKDDLEGARKLVLVSQNAKQLGDLAGRFAGRGQYAKAVELYELWWPQQQGWTSWMHVDEMKGAVIAYWRAGKRTELAKLLGETVQNMKNVDAKRKLGCKIAAECFRTGKLAKADVDKIIAGLDPKLVRDGIPYGAGLLVEVGLYEEPKMLGEMRQALFVHQPRNIAPVRYVANAPTDAGSWLASGLMTPENRNVCNQRIGKEAAERLITDVNVIRGGKETGEGAKAEEIDSWFYVCYDEQGVHLLFEHNDPKIDEVVRGKTRPTDYEMYLAIGEGEQVYQFGVNPLKRQFDYCPDWNSPHKRFRRLSDYADFSSRPTPYGFATAMNISWDLAYHVLPENGTEWPFEMIHWSRSGGVTWGGTDIWQVSNWGHWKFEGLTDEVKAKICRVLMYKALARYNAEKNIATGGVIGKWKDTELGDPEFYEQCLKPLVEKLDAAAKDAEGEPDDATVLRLFAEVVPQWYDFRYYASELRTKYLSERFVR